ncbi:non-structural maintenance of chromosomes element 3 homolog isoform X2 [Hemicordylus capensis]|uniref:non-structural maintenance of chromosomes element 3 homolog isoform X2 n=1 Tax=Hemicordylus capensis TaxID=884348 RepID=UPI0023024805|nr:non-structural maintenance of chromosomes element 3 homolog isoform X2 [Hemicordylus capensis]
MNSQGKPGSKEITYLGQILPPHTTLSPWARISSFTPPQPRREQRPLGTLEKQQLESGVAKQRRTAFPTRPRRWRVDEEAHARSGIRAEARTSAQRTLLREMTQNRRSKGPGTSQAQYMDVDEDYPLTQTQTPSQVQRNLERHPQSQVQHKVNELVQFLLVKDQKKIPIKRADILKHVVKDYKDVYPEILRRANQTLQQVFGMELVEIDPKLHTYIIISNLPPLEGDCIKEDENHKMGLLIIILSLIFMKGNVVKDSAVWEMLRRLRIDCSGEKHKIFGDVKKLVTEEFVRQKYLEYTRLPHTDPPEFEFRWGPRAAKETSKKQILQFIAKIQNKNPKTWISQYNEAEAETNAAARQ